MTWIRVDLATLARRRVMQLRKNEDGATAVEFAIVSLPFLMLLLGTMSVGLGYFWIFTLENAVWAASRDLRTGAFQTNSGIYAGLGTAQEKIDKFQEEICARTPLKSDCLANSRVLVQSNATFNGITAPNCLNNENNLIDKSAADAAFSAGASSSVVMVTACYAWQFGGNLPFLRLGNMANGSFLIQASAAFRTEPY